MLKKISWFKLTIGISALIYSGAFLLGQYIDIQRHNLDILQEIRISTKTFSDKDVITAYSRRAKSFAIPSWKGME
jgi:hypothetical protein